MFVALALPVGVGAMGIYQEPKDFLKEVFAGDVPKPSVLWITGDMRSEIKQILGHDLNVLRIRHWERDGRTAWILEEIGKEQPITTGIVVAEDKIERIKVLIFREGRGWEVRYPFFTDQFPGAGLRGNHELDRAIDGIAGATLSVRALTKLAQLALYLHRHSNFADEPP
jgi:FMN-binding domain.